MQVEFGQSWSMFAKMSLLVKFGQKLLQTTELGRSWPNLGRILPRLIEFGQSLLRIGQLGMKPETDVVRRKTRRSNSMFLVRFIGGSASRSEMLKHWPFRKVVSKMDAQGSSRSEAGSPCTNLGENWVGKPKSGMPRFENS